MFHVILHCSVLPDFRRSYFISSFPHTYSNHSVFHVIPNCFISLLFYVFLYLLFVKIYTFSAFANTSPNYFLVNLLCFTSFQCFHTFLIFATFYLVSSLYFRLPVVYHVISVLQVLFYTFSNHFCVYLLCFTVFYLLCVRFSSM